MKMKVSSEETDNHIQISNYDNSISSASGSAKTIDRLS